MIVDLRKALPQHAPVVGFRRRIYYVVGDKRVEQAFFRPISSLLEAIAREGCISHEAIERMKDVLATESRTWKRRGGKTRDRSALVAFFLRGQRRRLVHNL